MSHAFLNNLYIISTDCWNLDMTRVLCFEIQGTWLPIFSKKQLEHQDHTDLYSYHILKVHPSETSWYNHRGTTMFTSYPQIGMMLCSFSWAHSWCHWTWYNDNEVNSLNWESLTKGFGFHLVWLPNQNSCCYNSDIKFLSSSWQVVYTWKISSCVKILQGLPSTNVHIWKDSQFPFKRIT